MPLEFLDDPPPADGDLGERPAARRHVPTWLTAVAVAAAVAIAVLVATQHSPSGAPTALRTAARSSSPAPAPSPRPVSRLNPAAATLLALAEQARPLTDYERFGGSPTSCAQVSIHRTPPQRAVAAAIDAIIGSARSTTAARVINQFQGLCELVVRAVERRYVVVAMITSPTSPGRRRSSEFVQLGNIAIADDVLAYVQVVSVTNWSVLVGTLGTDRAPDRDLLALAHDPRMRW